MRPLRYVATMHPHRTTIIAALVGWVLACWVPVPALSLLGALPLIFWLPGAALLRLSRSARSPSTVTGLPVGPSMVLLPRPEPSEHSPMDVTGVAVSTALSAAIAIAVGLGLALTTKHLPRVPAPTILAGLTVAFVLLAARMSPTLDGQLTSAPRPDGLPRARWIVPTAITCCVLTGLLGYLSWRLYITPPRSDTYTVLSLDQQDNRTVIVVTNHQATTTRFQLRVSRGNRTIVDRTFRLTVGAEYQLKLPPGPIASSTSHDIARLMTEPDNKVYRILVL